MDGLPRFDLPEKNIHLGVSENQLSHNLMVKIRYCQIIPMNRFPIFVAQFIRSPQVGSFSQLHNAEREPLRPVALKVLEARPEASGMAVL